MKRFKDATQYEMIKIFNKNEQLQRENLDDMIETESYFISEQLDILHPSLLDYDLTLFNHKYMEIAHHLLFIERIAKLQHDYCIFTEHDYKRISEIGFNIAKANRFKELYILQLEKQENGILNNDNQLNHFLETYQSIRMNENYFYNENYELFRYEINSLK